MAQNDIYITITELRKIEEEIIRLRDIQSYKITPQMSDSHVTGTDRYENDYQIKNRLKELHNKI